VTMATAEGPPGPPVVLPSKEPETPEVNWAGVPKELHGKVHGRLDQFKGMWSGNLGELKAATHHIQLKPDAKPVYWLHTGLDHTVAGKSRSTSRKCST